jgi:hypothetical protein
VKKKGPKTQRLKLLPSEQLYNLIGWRSRAFSEGHGMFEIDEMSYWDMDNYVKFITENRPKQPGETIYKELKPAQRRMIEERKKRVEKEKKL